MVGGRGEVAAVAPLDIPSEYDLGTGSLEGPGANVARLYAAFARDLRDGTPGATAPDFAHALRLHRTLDGIAHAAASSVAQTLGQGADHDAAMGIAGLRPG